MHYIDSVYETWIHTNVNFPPLGVFDIKLGYSRFELSFNFVIIKVVIITKCPIFDGDAVSQNTIIQQSILSKEDNRSLEDSLTTNLQDLKPCQIYF